MGTGDDAQSAVPRVSIEEVELQSHYSVYCSIVDPIVELVLESSVASAQHRQYVRPFDANRVRHALRLLMRVFALDYLLLKYLSQTELRVTPALQQVVEKLHVYEDLPAVLHTEESYLHLLVATALR